MRTDSVRNRDIFGGSVPDTASRLLRLLGLLQRRPKWNGPELAEALGVEARTVRRDIDRLRNLGYQVDASPGSGGGYRLGIGAQVPPLLLDEEEATAVAVVLGVMASVAVPGVERGALAALTKLDRLLPPRLRGQLVALRASTVALLPRMEAVPAEQLVSFARACDAHERVTFAYRAHDGAETERRAEPHRLVATDRRWYVVAFDLDRGDWRTFRVDRAESVLLTGHTFVPRRLDDPGRMVAEGIATAGYDYRAVVRLQAPLEQVARRVQPTVGVLTGDGHETIAEIGADDFDWLAGYLIGLGWGFEVLEPMAWRARMARLSRRLALLHRGASSGRPERRLGPTEDEK
jgi:predicted DNA-binding transcriptional regulator YafY